MTPGDGRRVRITFSEISIQRVFQNHYNHCRQSSPSTLTTGLPDTTMADTAIKKLEDLIPASLTKFDAFPKIPKAYKARSESRGFLTLGVLLLAFLLMLNDIGEYLYGWPDYEFGVDDDTTSFLPINLDMTVNMPCHCTSD